MAARDDEALTPHKPLAGDAPKNLLFGDLCDYLEDEALARRLVENFGGQRVAIPKKLRDGHAFTLALGEDGAKCLIRIFGGERLEIPRGEMARDARTDYIVALHRRGGLTQNEIARRAGCTARWVRKVLRKRGL